MSYIVVEGLDFAGKSTLSKKFNDYYNCELVYEPFCNTPISKRIYNLLKKYDSSQYFKIQMFLASRIEMFTKLNNLTYLESDKHLISDRNFISSAVYQSEKESDIKRIVDFNTSNLASYNFNPIPQVIVYLEVPYELALERFNSREDANDLDKFVIVEENYLLMQEKYKVALDFLESKYDFLKIIRTDQNYIMDDIVEEIDSHLESLSANLNKK